MSGVPPKLFISKHFYLCLFCPGLLGVPQNPSVFSTRQHMQVESNPWSGQSLSLLLAAPKLLGSPDIQDSLCFSCLYYFSSWSVLLLFSFFVAFRKKRCSHRLPVFGQICFLGLLTLQHPLITQLFPPSFLAKLGEVNSGPFRAL